MATNRGDCWVGGQDVFSYTSVKLGHEQMTRCFQLFMADLSCYVASKTTVTRAHTDTPYNPPTVFMDCAVYRVAITIKPYGTRIQL